MIKSIVLKNFMGYNEFKSDEFANVNVYPLVADILGLKIDQPIDGKIKVLKKILKEKK